ncbi:MAG: ferredoxin Fer [Halanaeroarchaeum sp.]
MPTVEYLNYEALEDEGWDLDDDDLFDQADGAGLDEEDYGTLDVAEGEYILEAAEAQGYDWPFSCRAGACANCAAIIKEGEIDMDMQQILSDEEVSITCRTASSKGPGSSQTHPAYRFFVRGRPFARPRLYPPTLRSADRDLRT